MAARIAAQSSSRRSTQELSVPEGQRSRRLSVPSSSAPVAAGGTTSGPPAAGKTRRHSMAQPPTGVSELRGSGGLRRRGSLNPVAEAGADSSRGRRGSTDTGQPTGGPRRTRKSTADESPTTPVIRVDEVIEKLVKKVDENAFSGIPEPLPEPSEEFSTALQTHMETTVREEGKNGPRTMAEPVKSSTTSGADRNKKQ